MLCVSETERQEALISDALHETMPEKNTCENDDGVTLSRYGINIFSLL